MPEEIYKEKETYCAHKNVADFFCLASANNSDNQAMSMSSSVKQNIF